MIAMAVQQPILKPGLLVLRQAGLMHAVICMFSARYHRFRQARLTCIVQTKQWLVARHDWRYKAIQHQFSVHVRDDPRAQPSSISLHHLRGWKCSEIPAIRRFGCHDDGSRTQLAQYVKDLLISGSKIEAWDMR